VFPVKYDLNLYTLLQEAQYLKGYAVMAAQCNLP
jgi:hypothetical protein